jgi:DNA helicase-2/ATP-dependent DNA helicase PcrA
MPLDELNPLQQKAVLFDKTKPLIILAGAGSGKTKVLTHRAVHLIQDEGVLPASILLLTFTNKAAHEMLSRVRALLGSNSGIPTGGTFHSFSVRVLRKFGLAIGIPDSFSIFDENDQIDTVKRAMQILAIDPKSVKPSSVLYTISDAKSNLIGEKEYAGYAKGNFQQTVARVYVVYQSLLRQFSALDFDDLLLKTVKLFQDDKATLEYIREQFPFVLIDEYQDTNKAQYELTKLLAVSNQQLTVVGDASQAIYSWRGADYRNLEYLKRDFPGISTINLEQNYRSTQNILMAANNVIEKNKKHPILKLWTNKAEGEKVTTFQAESEVEEAQYIINEIKSKLSSGIQLSDYAILYRTNAQSRVVEEAFLHDGIPYVLFGGTRFYERKEVKDILSYLRLIINPSDDISRKRAEKNGKGRMKKLEEAVTEIDLNTNTIDILDLVLKITGYLDLYDLNNEEDAMRIENIKELRSVATEFPVLSEFLQQISLTERESKSRDIRSTERDREAVTLMTLHSAKGLEFKRVFMIGMEEGLFPHSRALLSAEEMEEERRLCYVGMTRAMDKLYLLCALRRLYFGQRNSNPASRFLADIPEELIETQNKFNRRKINHISEQWGFDENGNWKWSPDD